MKFAIGLYVQNHKSKIQLTFEVSRSKFLFNAAILKIGIARQWFEAFLQNLVFGEILAYQKYFWNKMV